MYTLTTTKKQCGDNDSNLLLWQETAQQKIANRRTSCDASRHYKQVVFLSQLMNWAQF